MNMNTKEMVIEKAEKMAAFLKEAEDLPSMKQFRAEKAAAILATRTEAAGKIETAKKEQAEVIPKLIEDRGAKEAKWKEAKAALDTAVGEYHTAKSTMSIRSQSFGHAISQQEQTLIESADPAIDEAITFFRGKLDWLRVPGRISRNAIGAESNIVTEKKTVKSESNIDAINAALQYGMAAIKELERMKLTPALDLQKIEGMKKGIPGIDVFTEYSGSKPYGATPPYVIPRFGGAASDEYEKTLLDRLMMRANDLLSKPASPASPAMAKKRVEPGKEATMETYKKRGKGYFAAGGTYNY